MQLEQRTTRTHEPPASLSLSFSRLLSLLASALARPARSLVLPRLAEVRHHGIEVLLAGAGWNASQRADAARDVVPTLLPSHRRGVVELLVRRAQNAEELARRRQQRRRPQLRAHGRASVAQRTLGGVLQQFVAPQRPRLLLRRLWHRNELHGVALVEAVWPPRLRRHVEAVPVRAPLVLGPRLEQQVVRLDVADAGMQWLDEPVLRVDFEPRAHAEPADVLELAQRFAGHHVRAALHQLVEVRPYVVTLVGEHTVTNALVVLDVFAPHVVAAQVRLHVGVEEQRQVVDVRVEALEHLCLLLNLQQRKQ